ncbi:MAG TPA: hypothetical protein VMW65_04620, partial [Chloroflexota bacterium]|nr:hypothetical protein [Chloroflexota bacterium]
CRLNSMQLAQKANVPLDAVNCVENQIHQIEPSLRAKIAHALGISEELLDKIDGSKPMTREEWDLFNSCLEATRHGLVPPDCACLGYEEIYH